MKIAVDAVLAASQPHHFLAVTKQGRSAIATTRGNTDCHVILRGGRTPNYDASSIDAAWSVLSAAQLTTSIMVDCSHGNSNKQPANQSRVAESLAQQIEAGEHRIGGLMLESHLVSGRQDLVPGRPLVYGQSITDACIDWESSVPILERLATAVAKRRRSRERDIIPDLSAFE